MWKFWNLNFTRGATAESIGKSGPPSEFDCEKIWKKKAQPLSQELRIVFAKQIYIRTVTKTIKTKRFTISEESNKKREINELGEKFANVW